MSDSTATERQQVKYDAAATEAKWRATWEQTELYNVDDADPRPKWYSLTMYPYPSGILHVGHWYAFAVPDSFARFKRMQGYNVLFPMGFDAFGLPAENAAIKHNIHPNVWTMENIPQMRRQYDLMGAMIDWSRELASNDPDYYKWNQWIFLKMLENGIAYRKDGAVWWCPKDQTVLANEQVLDGNICERCGTEVYKRDLEQWYFRITNYADELLDELDGLDWPERVKTMQRNWIGRSAGARLTFSLETGDALEVFTTRPDTVYGATFMVIAPEHPLVSSLTTDDQRDVVETYVKTARNMTEIERLSTDEARAKTGVFTGSYAINPLTDERIPVWIADYVLMTYGTGAIMAVPSGDERDFQFARAFDLPIRVVVQPEGVELDPDTMTEAYTGPGVMVNSGVFNGRQVPDAVPEIIEYLNKEGRGQAEITYRLRDWLISRQRYWGTPIPVVYCDACGMQPVPYEQLPVLLPLDAEFTPTGQSPLQSHEGFLNTTCPSCGGAARRETDTMDTFMDSSWYWFRYTSPGYDSAPFNPELAKEWTPVDLYSGGIEHAILHLLYARFFTKVLRDFGLVDHGEPFVRLRNQGMILAEEGTKMSKSRGTQVAPDELALQYGADALRLHLMFLGPWDQGGPWNSRGIVGMERFIRRALQLVTEAAGRSFDGSAPPDDVRSVVKAMHKTIKRVTEDISGFHFNTMVAGMIEYVNELTKRKDGPVANTPDWNRAIETLVLLMAPSTPYVAEEMWERLGKPYSVHQQEWPDFVEEFTRDDVVEIAVQVNGKVRDKLMMSADASEADALRVARSSERVQQFAGDATPKRVIYVPGRLLNIIV
jgi:leucyl-tRNA synthetase